MTILILLSLLVGAVVGMRFKVLIIGPILVVNVVVVFAGGAAAHIDISTLFLAAVLVIVFLQVGYFIGIIIRYVMALARTGRLAEVPRSELNPSAEFNRLSR